jgi:hypothetical protein
MTATDAFGLGETIEVEIDGPSPSLQTLAADPPAVVLLIDGNPLRGAVTNVAYAAPSTLATNSTTVTNIFKITNVVGTVTKISHAPALTPKQEFTGHPGTLRMQFELRRTEANKAEWNNLLGSPVAMRRNSTVEIGIETNNIVYVLAKVIKPPQLTVLRSEPFFSPQSTQWWLSLIAEGAFACGLYWNVARMRSIHDAFTRWTGACWLGLIAATYACFGGAICFAVFIFIFLSGTVYLARFTEALRDSGPQPPRGKLRTYSLARIQMAVWFFLAVSAFVFLWLMTDTTNTITGTVLALMGIGAGTALGAEAQHIPKASENLESIKARLTELKSKNLRSQQEDCELERLEILTLDVPCLEKELDHLQASIEDLNSGANVATLNQQLAALSVPGANPPQSLLNEINDRLARWGRLPQDEARVEEIKAQLRAYPVSKGFCGRRRECGGKPAV